MGCQRVCAGNGVGRLGGGVGVVLEKAASK